MTTIRTLLKLAASLAVMYAGLGLVLAFGLFAFIGMPLLAIGLGLTSSAIDEINA